MTKQSLLLNYLTPKRPRVEGNGNVAPTSSMSAPSSPAPRSIDLEAMPILKTMGPKWLLALQKEFTKPYFKSLNSFLQALRRSGKKIYPTEENVFSWSRFTEPMDVKVVILGQDPYHGPNQAHGLCFSVLRPTRPPPSLQNIYKYYYAPSMHNHCQSWILNFRELKEDIPEFTIPDHGDLTSWAKQGVLLLNAVLTVEGGNANSHKNRGWEELTDAVISYLNERRAGLVFLLWGSDAHKKGSKINEKKHLVLKSSHPSPFSVLKGFSGCKHFSQTNDHLKKMGLTPIAWEKL